MSAVTPLPTDDVHLKRNQKNRLITESLEAAALCVKRLVNGGYTVLDIELTRRQTVVWIRHCDRCDKLLGVLFTTKGSITGRIEVYQAMMLGCRVQWEVKQ